MVKTLLAVDNNFQLSAYRDRGLGTSRKKSASIFSDRVRHDSFHYGEVIIHARC